MKKFDPQAARNPDLTANPAYRFLGINDADERQAPQRGEKAKSAKAAPEKTAAGPRALWNTTGHKERREFRILLYTTQTITDALKSAKDNTEKPVNQLINEILEQALRDAGYIGGEK